MNETVIIVAIIRKKLKILLIRGNSDQGRYRLPSVMLASGQQPESLIKDFLLRELNFNAENLYLSNAIALTEMPVVGAKLALIYEAVAQEGQSSVHLINNEDSYRWKNLDSLPFDRLAEPFRSLIEVYRQGTSLSSGLGQDGTCHDKSVAGAYVVNSDGGSRGNPGVSAAGYSIKDDQGRVVFEGGAYLGITTNNQAEYHGVYLGLEKARELGLKNVECQLDSLLVVNQLNGQYAIRNRELWPIHERIKDLLTQFDRVAFRHVKREYNQQADNVVNRILDTQSIDG